MRVLRSPNKHILSAYSKVIEAAKNDDKRRLHRYMVIKSCGSEIFAYNSLTGEVVMLDKQRDNLFSDYFVEHLFYVPNDFDEIMIALGIKTKLFNDRPKDVNINGYVIVTTTGCNAKCFYCYEKGVAQNRMSESTANDVADFITKRYSETKRIQSIQWFGGEPLYNKKVIDIICGKLKENKVEFKSTIITNGYLFNKKLSERVKDDWNLTLAQITIDGTEEKYNKTKRFIYKKENPFKTVTDNIENLIKNGVSVSIRVNIGYYNKEDIFELVKFIKERYKDCEAQPSVYIHELFEYSGITDINSKEKEKAVFEKIMEISEWLHENGLGGDGSIRSSLSGTHCMGDNKSTFVIQTDGKLSTCEHFVTGNTVGSIYSDEFDLEGLERSTIVSPPEKMCLFCPIFPECSKLEICEDMKGECNENKQRYNIWLRTHMFMRDYKNQN